MHSRIKSIVLEVDGELKIIELKKERQKPFNRTNIVYWNSLITLLAKRSHDEPANSVAALFAEELLKLIDQAKGHLNTLANNPRRLVDLFSQRIDEIVSAYEFNYPTSQSPVTSNVLKELKLYAADISYYQGEMPEFEMQSSQLKYINNLNRQCYLELCGLLYKAQGDLIYGLQVVDNDRSILHNQIKDLCRLTHILESEALPDEWDINGENCRLAYIKRKQNSRVKMTTLAEDYASAKEKIYNYLANLANSNNAFMQNLYQDQVNKIIDTLDSAFALPDFDLKFAVTLLENTRKVIDPTQTNTTEEYCRLANLTKGMPSGGKKLQGLMLGLAATALILSGVMIGFTSGGMAMPASIYMIGTGLNFMNIAKSILLISAGSYGLVKSAGIFKQGMRQGLSQDMIDLAKLRAKVDSGYRPAPAIR